MNPSKIAEHLGHEACFGIPLQATLRLACFLLVASVATACGAIPPSGPQPVGKSPGNIGDLRESPPRSSSDADTTPTLSGTLSLNKTVLDKGEPIIATLTIRNIGNQPVAVATGGDYRSGRPERFRLRVTDENDEAKVYRELCRAVEEWVAIHHEDHQPLPPPTAGREYSGKFVVRVGKELHRELAIEALRRNESLNSYCLEALRAPLAAPSGGNGERRANERTNLAKSARKPLPAKS